MQSGLDNALKGRLGDDNQNFLRIKRLVNIQDYESGL